MLNSEKLLIEACQLSLEAIRNNFNLQNEKALAPAFYACLKALEAVRLETRWIKQRRPTKRLLQLMDSLGIPKNDAIRRGLTIAAHLALSTGHSSAAIKLHEMLIRRKVCHPYLDNFLTALGDAAALQPFHGSQSFSDPQTPFPFGDARVPARIKNIGLWVSGHRPKTFEDFIKLRRSVLHSQYSQKPCYKIGAKSFKELDPIFEENGFGEAWQNS